MADQTLTPRAAEPSGGGAASNFTDKWRSRWPEWAVAEVFVPRDQRERALAWASLLQELTDAAWGGGDPTPGAAKLGWWQEELVGWSRGVRRHPLGSVLKPHRAPWAGLATALPSLVASRDRPRDTDDAFTALKPFGEAVAAVEQALFDDARPMNADAVARATTIVASLLQWRFHQPGDDLVPLSMLARSGEGDRRKAWAAELAANWPPHAGGRVRRLLDVLSLVRLGKSDPASPLNPWAVIWLAWRAARGGSRN